MKRIKAYVIAVLLIGWGSFATASYTRATLTSHNRTHPGVGENLSSPYTSYTGNENSAMFGGWGPHLRGLMRAPDNSFWFTVDQGPDTGTNTRIHYYRFDGTSWKLRGSQNHFSNIQQNAASVMIGDYIWTYAVQNAGTYYLQECFFRTDLTVAEYKSCNAVVVGGTPSFVNANSNYVGAAVSPSGYKVVWWSTVGANAATPGTFYYIYNFGSGWNGPVAVSLNSLTSPDCNSGSDTNKPIWSALDYVNVSFVDDGNLVYVGQLQKHTKCVSNQEFQAVTGTLQLGQQPTMVPLSISGEINTSSEDIWYDSSSGDVHVLNRTVGGGLKVGYYYKAGSSSWGSNPSPSETMTNGFRARFSFDEAADKLYLIRGGASSSLLEVKSIFQSSISGAISWSGISAETPTLPADGFGMAAGIFVQSRSYQSRATDGLHFGICGNVDDGIDHGNVILHYSRN